MLSVSDDGPGIPAEPTNRVFETFYPVPGRAGGSGLGMAPIRRIARLYGGDARLAVTGKDSSGASIVIELPAAAAEPSA